LTTNDQAIKERLLFIRCSRPLCSSQTTTPWRTSDPRVLTAGTPGTAREPGNNRPAPPEKGARTCCLRTQQCAISPAPRPAAGIPGTPKGAVLTRPPAKSRARPLIFHP
jgi:hypothetical protein